ncbi:TetR/AcrR family transcriptional regulator [Xanthobacter tagetidis]|jgi:AcrR family transcriptional regulator|uniref:TetR/AcrR family transcriptional regulator n=1 Tax=Xanthobacter tagetidis TaxID=60216 RepID=A0A3L7AHR2_9HYPH|nr:TetR/AcrR family transcriptional regulator [Xanthobacter tagetidis]RLP80023.1 TetR/AcrR family transcriptional regulator [Xanthobacter tagetidis]
MIYEIRQNLNPKGHPAVNVRGKETADETRERIAQVAEELFRRMGFAKTAVADIAAELGMSPANVYRFFPSKTAIVEAICQKCLTESEVEVAQAATGPGTPQDRIVAAYASILAYHKANFLAERRVHDMVQVAIEHNWQNIEAHKARIAAMVAGVLAEGMESGTFVPHVPAQVSAILLGACVRFCHPVLIAQNIDEDLEGQLDATVRFILRAVEAERAPLAAPARTAPARKGG